MKTPVTFILLFIIAGFTQFCKKDTQVAKETELQKIKTTFTNITWYRTSVINDLSKMISMIDSANGFVTSANFEYAVNGKLSKVSFVQQGAVTQYYEFEYSPSGAIIKRQLTSGTLVLT